LTSLLVLVATSVLSAGSTATAAAASSERRPNCHWDSVAKQNVCVDESYQLLNCPEYSYYWNCPNCLFTPTDSRYCNYNCYIVCQGGLCAPNCSSLSYSMPYYAQSSQYCNWNYNTQQRIRYNMPYYTQNSQYCKCNYNTQQRIRCNVPHYTQDFCITNYPPNYLPNCPPTQVTSQQTSLLTWLRPLIIVRSSLISGVYHAECYSFTQFTVFCILLL